MPRSIALGVFLLLVGCGPRTEEPSDRGSAGAGGAGETLHLGGGAGGCDEPAPVRDTSPQSDHPNCSSWEVPECAESSGQTPRVVVSIDGVDDAVLDVPVDDTCSEDVYFLWSTCAGTSPALWAKSMLNTAVLDMQLERNDRCGVDHLQLTFGRYVDSAGATWELEELSWADYAEPNTSSEVVTLRFAYLGRDGSGREAEILVDALACKGTYPCIL